MADYNVQESARQILLANLLNDERLGFSPEIKAACEKVTFVGHPKPFLPTPVKMTETISVFSALVGAAASVVAEERYGIQQDVQVNTNKASNFIMSFFFPNVEGEPCAKSAKIQAKGSKGDLYDYFKPIHQKAMLIYKCKDEKWIHLHCSFDARPVMKLLGIPEQDVTDQGAIKIYAEKAKQWNCNELEDQINDVVHGAAGRCYDNPDEFLATPHGQAMKDQPLANIKTISAPKVRWPQTEGTEYRPLSGIRVIDFSRAVAAPAISKILAVLGADVIRVSYDKIPDMALSLLDTSTGKRDVNVDLNTDDGQRKLKDLLKDADVLVDGFRPGVLERHGFNSVSMRKINPSLIYVRENCYGWTGPWSHRSGWQQIADSITGLCGWQGQFFGLDEPVVPLLPNSDYQIGVLAAGCIIQALIKRTREDVTFDIDVSLIAYDLWLSRLGRYDEAQSAAIKALNNNLVIRHYDAILDIYKMMAPALNQNLPGVIGNPEFFITMSGKNWGEDRDISIVGPPFEMSKSKLGYLVPSGPTGWSDDDSEWRPRHY